jgi:hypothetical protein
MRISRQFGEHQFPGFCRTYITNMRIKSLVNQHDTCQPDNIIELALLLLYTTSWQL